MRRQSVISNHIVIGLISLFALFCCAVSAEQKILMVNDSDWPPYFFKGNASETPGLGKELLNQCLQEQGFSVDYTYYPLKRMKRYIEQGVIDTNIYSYRKDREKFLVYGQEPLFK